MLSVSSSSNDIVRSASFSNSLSETLTGRFTIGDADKPSPVAKRAGGNHEKRRASVIPTTASVDFAICKQDRLQCDGGKHTVKEGTPSPSSAPRVSLNIVIDFASIQKQKRLWRNVTRSPYTVDDLDYDNDRLPPVRFPGVQAVPDHLLKEFEYMFEYQPRKSLQETTQHNNRLVPTASQQSVSSPATSHPPCSTLGITTPTAAVVAPTYAVPCAEEWYAMQATAGAVGGSGTNSNGKSRSQKLRPPPAASLGTSASSPCHGKHPPRVDKGKVALQPSWEISGKAITYLPLLYENHWKHAKNLDVLARISLHKTPITLTDIDCLCIHYSQEHDVRYRVRPTDALEFVLHESYTDALTTCQRTLFDAFARNHRILVEWVTEDEATFDECVAAKPASKTLDILWDKKKNVGMREVRGKKMMYLITSAAQLNFFSWAMKNKVVDYCVEHHEEVAKHVQKVAALSRAGGSIHPSAATDPLLQFYGYSVPPTSTVALASVDGGTVLFPSQTQDHHYSTGNNPSHLDGGSRAGDDDAGSVLNANSLSDSALMLLCQQQQIGNGNKRRKVKHQSPIHHAIKMCRVPTVVTCENNVHCMSLNQAAVSTAYGNHLQ